jgi:hypothetical protein
MRTLILAVTVLLIAAPVWATVTITAELDGKTITIGYTSDEGQRIRAVAIDVAATGGNIIAVGDYAVGDDNGGYGIFPSSFRDNIVVNPETGEVDSWVGSPNPYTPVADPCDPDALGGIGTPGVTIEMGSLYPEGGSAPSATSGILCSVTVDDDVTEVCITANATRGNVVLEDANEPDTLVLPDCIPIGGECYPTTNPTKYARWVTLGKPGCWCGVGTGGRGGDGLPSRGMQCYGDTDNKAQYNYYEVYTDDLAIFAADWKKLCGATLVNPCSDTDHVCQYGYYADYTDDLARLVLGWKKTLGTLATDCPMP